MQPDELQQLRDQLIGHEGCKLKPYADVAGKITIGVGRNLTDKGLSTAEVTMLLDNDILECIADLMHTYSWFVTLDQVRQHAIIDMRFNLGAAGFARFPNLIHALAVADYQDAARQMLASLWAQQVGHRADDLAAMMRNGA